MAGHFLKGRKNIYVPIREIGSGGTAQVSLAVELPWGKYRAVKIRGKKSASGLGTLEAEARLLEQLTLSAKEYPALYNIPCYYEYFQDAGKECLVMEYLQGETAGELLRKGKRFHAEEILRMTVELCRILEALHSQTPPVLYLDLNPDNVFLKPDGIVVLTDLGAAAAWYWKEEMPEQVMYGTRGFAAPEQYRGEAESTADIYSLGVLIRQMWERRTDREKQMEKWMDECLIRCTREMPADRYQTIREVRLTLEEMLQFSLAEPLHAKSI